MSVPCHRIEGGQGTGRHVARLAALGWREQALVTVEEAVTIRRSLARARPRLSGSVLSRSLDHLAAALSRTAGATTVPGGRTAEQWAGPQVGRG